MFRSDFFINQMINTEFTEFNDHTVQIIPGCRKTSVFSVATAIFTIPLVEYNMGLLNIYPRTSPSILLIITKMIYRRTLNEQYNNIHNNNLV